MTQLPIPKSYWVIPHALLAGEYPRDIEDDVSQSKIDALIAGGVRVFIDLTEAGESLKSYTQFFGTHPNQGITHERYGILDVSVPRSHDETAAILDAIDHHVSLKHVVYVHCRGGIGRTGTIIGCWLSRHGEPGDAALIRLKELWKQCPKSAYTTSPETREQERYVREWTEA